MTWKRWIWWKRLYPPPPRGGGSSPSPIANPTDPVVTKQISGHNFLAALPRRLSLSERIRRKEGAPVRVFTRGCGMG